MEHVKRLVLMPEHMVENTTQSKPLVPPLTSQVNHLDSVYLRDKTSLKMKKLDYIVKFFNAT